YPCFLLLFHHSFTESKSSDQWSPPITFLLSTRKILSGDNNFDFPLRIQPLRWYCTPKVRVENLILGVFYMVKYSEEFKLKIIKEYLKGSLGYKLLAKKYQIPHESSIKSWVRNYKE